jgi:coupling of ubiquitin conjugation to ER degradation protein 1
MTEQTLNVPQLLVFIIVSVLAVRWYLAKPSASGAQPTATGRRAGINVTAAQIDQVAQMFPQHDRRQIAWDLQRNGANLAVTTERILSGRALEVVSPCLDEYTRPIR